MCVTHIMMRQKVRLRLGFGECTARVKLELTDFKNDGVIYGRPFTLSNVI